MVTALAEQNTRELPRLKILPYRKTRVLVVGSGGREHAIVWKLLQELSGEDIFVAPGNAGTSGIAVNVPCNANDISGLADFARENRIDMTIVGPEDPLNAGIVDYFNERGLPIFGPSGRAARIEGSKVYAKRFMQSHRIPTADFVVVDSYADARKYGIQFLKDYGAGVLKLDGLAAGKGVVVYKSEKELDDGLAYLEKLMPHGRLVVEKRLKGEEVSFMAWSDGEHIVPMVPAQDHKPVYDGNEGPNTGGMGAYTNPLAARGIEGKIMREIMRPAVEGIANEQRIFKGVLYAGLMIVDGQPYVLEFNCRYGDPETEVIMPLLKSSLIDISQRCMDGTLNKAKAEWEEGEALGVVMATQGYPGDYQHNIGRVIYGLDETSALIFHAGTKYNEARRLVNSGGRVLNVVGRGRNLAEAYSLAYTDADIIHMRNRRYNDGARLHYRNDIGHKTLNARRLA